MNDAPVLVVDDEASIVTYVRLGLELEGFSVVTAATGAEALVAWGRSRPCLVVLDVMLPDVDGLEVCRRIRAKDPGLPVLLLTALGQSEDVVRGLDSGADAYLPKPFKLQELLVRVQALLRRVGPAPADLLSWDGLMLDRAARQVVQEGRRIDLTRREFALLEILIQSPRKVHGRSQLLEAVWGQGDHDPKNLKTCISDLRAKIGDDAHRILRTVRGTGYTLGG